MKLGKKVPKSGNLRSWIFGYLEISESIVLPWNSIDQDVTCDYPKGSASNKGTFVFSIKNRKRRSPCAYYANSTATFQPLLEGDLVFKLKPGPSQRGVISTHLGQSTRAKSRKARNISNLIEINRVPLNGIPNNSRQLSLCLLNAQSIRYKTADFVDYVCDHKYDLVAINETWLQKRDDGIRVELCPTGYELVEHPRLGRGGGGIGLLYRDCLRVNTVRSAEKKSIDYAELLVQLSTSCKLRIIIVYRTPSSENHRVPISNFLNEFSELMETVILSKELLLVLGDFNVHVDVPENKDAAKFLDLLESLGLEQHVTEPTHVLGHTLDLVTTRRTEIVLGSIPRSCRYLSDHAAVRCSICINKPAPRAKKKTYRKIKSVDINSLKHDIAQSDLCLQGCAKRISSCEDLDKFVQGYNSTLSSILDRHAPLKSKVVRSRPQVPWYNQEIDEAKRMRRNSERTWRRTKSAEDLLVFKSLRNLVTYLCNRAC